jgi:hypothetical protein
MAIPIPFPSFRMASLLVVAGETRRARRGFADLD